jgi:DNA-binding beta-propeller fold protein YncE
MASGGPLAWIRGGAKARPGERRGAALVLLVALASGCGSSHKTLVGTMSQLRKERISAVINVGGAPNAPDWQAQASDSVWIANSDKQTIQRIDPRTDGLRPAKATIYEPCAGLVVAFNSVWSEDCGQDALIRVDQKTGQEMAHIALTPEDSEGLIAATQTAVYALGRDPGGTGDFVAKIDPESNNVLKKIPVSPGSAAAAAGFGSIWVTNPLHGTVARIDTETDRVAQTTKTKPGARFLAVGEGAVWVLNQSDGSVSRIDPTSGSVVATIPAKVPGDGGCIATGLGSVWVTMPRTPVLRIDAKSNRITERWQGPGGDCISVGFGSIWLSNHDFGNVWRIKP